MEQNDIIIKNCQVESLHGVRLSSFSWELGSSVWLITGPNGGGKEDFLSLISGKKNFSICGENSFYKNDFLKTTCVVSLEEAARLIEEERELDETDHLDRIDEGRTARRFICEVLGGPDARHRAIPLPPIASRLETLPEVKLCGVEKILDRGLKFLSTGEIRRTLLCRALLSKSQLLILSDPFAGLDAESRKILFEFFSSISDGRAGLPKIIISMERYSEIPSSVTNVAEFSSGTLSFCGTKAEYERVLDERRAGEAWLFEEERAVFRAELETLVSKTAGLIHFEKNEGALVEMNNVNVGWNEKFVLRDFSWKVLPNEHWLIQGPNGSGKTTLLELITGDNKQCFSNDVRLFGKRRGSGESIWDIKKRLGIVSYRLHVEYRMVGGTDLEGVIISGFRDSIGLYEARTDSEVLAARLWLKLGGFAGREKESFANLSYGEQRAILILRAAVKLPSVLILDEPCHALDELNRVKVLDLLEKIAETGTTTLLHVTHDPEEALPCEKHVLQLLPNQTPMYTILKR